MFFFNGRIRNVHIVPMIFHDRPYTHKVGHSGIIVVGCLSIITGLIFIVIGVISQTQKRTFISMGIISLSVGLSVTTLVCFHTKLNICYHNWAYGPHIVPSNVENSQLGTMTGTVQTIIPLSPPKPVKMLSNAGINKVLITPTIEIGKTTTNADAVT